MKILMFTPYVPYPPNSGGQTRTFNLIKNLSKKHQITSLCFLREDQKEPDLRQLQKYCEGVEIVKRKKAWRSLTKIFMTGISPYPYLANMYLYPSVKSSLQKLLAQNKYDLIHVETYYIMPNIPPTDVPILLAEQTIEYLVYQHFAETTSIWPLKPLLYADVLKHKYWEKYYWVKANKVVAMSEADLKVMKQIVPNLDADIVPNGIDREFFSAEIKVSLSPHPTFLFVGQFNWLQNREAVEILAQRIWPIIKEMLPGANLWIVGRNPTKTIQDFSSSHVKVSGDVEDIRTAYQSSDCLIAPLYGGGGTRYKTLEAMASRLPVVSTDIGVEVLSVKNGYHALVSSDPEKLAQLAVEVVKNKVLAKKLAKNALALVTKNFDWQTITNKLEKIYEQTAGQS